MTPFRFILSALLLAAPAMAQTAHDHPAAAPTTAASVQTTPQAEDELDDLMWLDDADLMAFGLDDEMFIAPGAEPALGGFEHSGADGPMVMHDEADGGPAAPGMSMGHGAPGGMGHGGMGPGGPPGPMGRPGEVLPMFIQDELQCSDAQREQLAALQAEVDARLAQILSQHQVQQLTSRPPGPPHDGAAGGTNRPQAGRQGRRNRGGDQRPPME